MVLHIIVISLQCAVVAAFLLLWYLWVKGKLGAAFFLEGDEQVLFPFRYFSWIVIGLLVATSIVQIHFVRVSSIVHERMAALPGLYRSQEIQARSLESLKEMMHKVRSDMDANFQGLRSQVAEIGSRTQPEQPARETQQQQTGPLRKPALVKLATAEGERSAGVDAFAKAAQASRAPRQAAAIFSRPGAEKKLPTETYSMRLNRKGRVTADGLRVRNRPHPGATIIERLKSGQQVKVTEKRLLSDRMWFRVVTPTGRAGWVDFRYVRLQRSS